MKVTCTVIVLLATLLSVFAFPSPASNSKKDIEDDVELIPGRRNPFDPTIVDTGAAGGFPGSFGDFDGIFTRMRQQLDQLLRSFGGGSAPGFPSVQSGFPQIPGLDLGKGNTTSVTKVIDGHKVVINETEYNKQGDFGGAFFKVRIIDVKPDSSESTTATASSEGDDSTREVAENSAENEVTKNEALETNDLVSAMSSNDIETFDDAPLAFQPRQAALQDYSELELAETEAFDEVDNNFNYRDLSNDIDVNQFMADQGAPINPDAEVFFEPPNKNKHHFEKLAIPR